LSASYAFELIKAGVIEDFNGSEENDNMILLDVSGQGFEFDTIGLREVAQGLGQGQHSQHAVSRDTNRRADRQDEEKYFGPTVVSCWDCHGISFSFRCIFKTS